MYSLNGKVYKRKVIGNLENSIEVAQKLASDLKGDINE